MNDLQMAINAAYEASKEILKIYNKNYTIEFKSDNSPLTEADICSHKKIFNLLNASGYPILSEECNIFSYNERKKWDRYWLIDPIDGTKEFINKNEDFTVNIALIEKGKPILGIVMIPTTLTVYFGYERGSFKGIEGVHFLNKDDLINSISSGCSNLQKLNISRYSKSLLRVVTSSSHMNKKTEEFLNNLENYFDDIHTLPRGSSIKLCLIAEGKADIYPRLGPTSEWDIAAAHAIVHFAGGNVYIYDPNISPIEYINRSILLKEVYYNKKSLLNPFFIVH